MDPSNPANAVNAARDTNEKASTDPMFSSNSYSSSNSMDKNEAEVLESQPVKISEKLKNPLAGISRDQLMQDVETFAHEKGLVEHLDDLKKGALVAQNQKMFESMSDLTEEDKASLRLEKMNKWKQPFMMYFMTSKPLALNLMCESADGVPVLCAGSAIVQGMDQTAVNGAQLFYFEEFNITDVWIKGLLNGAPYLCSALIGCWTTRPLNKAFGRRGCIFISCFVSFAASFWMAGQSSLELNPNK
jgi:hypothetical protein